MSGACTYGRAVLQSTSLAQRFERALEEACELRDRRAGVTPATKHEPLDFRTEAVVYDPTIVPDADFSFEDLFPQLRAEEAAAFDPTAGVALLRAAARDPTIVRLPLLEAAAAPDDAAAERHAAMKVAERMVIWSRFYKAPKALQRQMCKTAMRALLSTRLLSTRLRRCVAHAGPCTAGFLRGAHDFVPPLRGAALLFCGAAAR